MDIDIPLPLIAFSTPMGYDVNNNSFAGGPKAGYNVYNVWNDIYNPVINQDIFIAVSDYTEIGPWQAAAVYAALENLKRNFGIQGILDDETPCAV